MKKIVKLKGELVFFIIISTILGFFLSSLSIEYYRNVNIESTELEASVIEENNNNLYPLKKQLNIESKSEEIVLKNIKRMNEGLKQSYMNKIFIVDNEGFVKYSTGKLLIEKFDVSNGEGNNLSINKNDKLATVTNIMRINENRYVVYINEMYIYNDLIIINCWILLSFIIFIALVSGRIKYISKIAKNVKEIAKGDLTKRVPLKYKNELTDLSEDINYMVEELHNQEINQKEFITNISHDLRTPLTTILGYSRMIEEKVYSNEEELEKYISIINKKGNYLKVMLEDFFHYAKISSRDIEVNKIPINLNEIVMQILDEEEVRFNENGLSLKVNLEKKALHTYGDSLLIFRAFTNLINNALKYSKENSTVEIALKFQIFNGIQYGVLSIKNTPKNSLKDIDIDKLFKRLYKIDKSRIEKGSGLGLAITQEIVSIHNGFIKANYINEKIEFVIGLIIG